MAEKKTRIGLVGFGTVGAGVAKIILENADAIKAKTGVDLELAKVVDLDTTSPRPVVLPEGMLSADINAILDDPTIDIGVELIGGTTVAKDIQLSMLNNSKHVVTANKALLAKYGPELYTAARENNVCIAFEASCAGGIPIVSAIRSGLAANGIQAIYGILNGTCNYILSNMTDKGSAFDDVLKAAQQKGYAEADPALDINGGDSAHKLAILASLAFGYDIALEDISVEGIEDVDIEDIKYAQEMGYVLKLLAIGEKHDDDRVSLRVHPSFLAKDSALARVDGPFNAVSVFGHAVGQTMYYGRGAGMMPTASAIVADIIEVAMGNSQNLFNAQTVLPRDATVEKIESVENLTSRFYIRLMVTDAPGTFAKIANILADHNISISGILQHEANDGGGAVPAIITTHPNLQKNVSAALADLKKLDIVQNEPICIRIVDIPEDNLED